MTSGLAGTLALSCNSNKPDLLAQDEEGGRDALMSSRHTSPVGFARTRDTKNPYAVGCNGHGFSSAMSRKMSDSKLN
jgi:hypothetical protein